MRLPRTLALLATLLTLGCRKPPYTPPETPMPPNTTLLSQMMRQLSSQPGFTDALIHQLDSGGKKGPALLTPKLLTELRNRILGKDWSGLDRFPGWTMREINPTVRVVGHFAGKDQKLEAASAVHPGTPISAAQAQTAAQYLDLGPYSLDKAETVALDTPSTLPPFTTDGIVTKIGNDIIRGDGPNALAPEHADSQRLADILNRLAANQLQGAQTFAVSVAHVPPAATPASKADRAVFHELFPDSKSLSASTPDQLITLLQQTGHTVTVNDARYFANFAHLHYKGDDVMAPFWINTGLKVPDSHGRPLLVPVSHAELEWHIHGPHLNADISYYFGIDGKSEWRTMDTLDQAWVLKRDAHAYTGKQAVEATRLASLLTIAYMHLHQKHPALPFGGYYALGVCQDGVSAIEHALTGTTTLYPNTADESFFTDSRDAEINSLFRIIPKDRDGHAPGPERIFGSLPVPAAKGAEPFAAITIPGLSADLNATYTAWQQGKLEGQHDWRVYIFWAVAIVLAMLAAVVSSVSKRDRLNRN
ncbi:hypothetical protein [Granulicella paludicola]|uniref:hypothetical protein n=1 Tax=Granulicella paludicola TaxID=474951 RepID=UPI0021E0B83D|nr:hypothetical protein [Granulicella paludicola]